MSATTSSPLCGCGCGAAAPIASKTNVRQGYTKGQPMRFVKGHHMRLPDYQQRLVATRGPWPDERRQRVSATLRAKAAQRPPKRRKSRRSKRSKSQRGTTQYWIVGGRYEHRIIMEQIMGRPLLRAEHVHHKDGNGLNNDPANLELLTAADHNRTTWSNRSDESRRAFARAGELAPDRWSRMYDACVKCGSTRWRHAAHGECGNCYRKRYGRYPH